MIFRVQSNSFIRLFARSVCSIFILFFRFCYVYSLITGVLEGKEMMFLSESVKKYGFEVFIKVE